MNAAAQLFLPPPPLAGVVFAAIGRDTRGAGLGYAARFNHFPASPLVALTVVSHGTTRLVRDAAPEDTPDLASVTLAGPQNRPLTSWSPGDVTALTLGFYPDAFERMTSVAPERIANQTTESIPAPLDRVVAAIHAETDLGAQWMAAAQALAGIDPDEAMTTAARLGVWGRGVVARATLSGPGRSMRAVERRLRHWVGQSRRQLDHFARIEALHEKVTQTPPGSLAELAAEMGYADQSHMGRDVRRATGFSPGALNRRIREEEAFWCYRLMGERF